MYQVVPPSVLENEVGVAPSAAFKFALNDGFEPARVIVVSVYVCSGVAPTLAWHSIVSAKRYPRAPGWVTEETVLPLTEAVCVVIPLLES